ncbi:hypothetical protein B9Z19DRAFT_1138144 [Tuber borchii]|uniref:Uncharacterized protein n=1 Tax=Tuber borchii TaxID=42251 RepID=A0A2T6Z9X2_TUBBO|nr:hypothetical protein B9Z19DRAFT_1138144 [Tuber borchii]
MHSLSILAKSIMLASIFEIVAAQGAPWTDTMAFTIIGTGVIPTTCTAGGQCGSGDLVGTAASLPVTSCSCTTYTPTTIRGTPAPIRGTKTTMKISAGSLQSDTSPLTGSGSGSGGMVALAATTTAPGGSTGVAAMNGGSVVAVVLLGSLVGLLGSW